MMQKKSAQYGIQSIAKQPLRIAIASGVFASSVLVTPFAAQAEEVKKATTETVLAPVEVRAKKHDDKAKVGEVGFVRKVTTIGRVAQEARDVPQSNTTVTQQLLKDQGAETLTEALRNVAGLTFNAGEGGRTGDNVTLRGFSAATDLYLDGARDIGQYNRDLFNTDRAEVLRGPASMLFGRGSTGGVINMLSKSPSLDYEIENSTNLTTTLGTNQFIRTEVDSNYELSDTSAFRLNVMGTKTHGDRPGVESKRFGIAPSVMFGIGTDTTFKLSYFHLKEDAVPDYGVPMYDKRPLDVPIDRGYVIKGFDYANYTTDIATIEANHEFNSGARLHNVLRFGKYSRDINPNAPRLNLASTGGVLTDLTVINRGHPGRAGTDKMLSNQIDLSGDIETGSMTHSYIVGLDYSGEDTDSNFWRDDPTTPSPTATVGDSNNNPTTPFATRQDTATRSFKSHSVGIFAQDTLSLNEQWKVVLGLRWDKFSASYHTITKTVTPNTLGDFARKDNNISYRAGVIYQPTTRHTLYASTGTSFNPSAEAYSLDVSSEQTDPEKNINYEIGARYDKEDSSLTARASLFRTVKTNERNPDTIPGSAFLLSGKRHTDGIELEVAARITEHWDLFAGATFMKSNIDKTNQAANLGKTALNTPNRTINLWNTYKFTPEWKAGLGFNVIGARYTSHANTNLLPSYMRWDAMVGWEKGKASVQLNIGNLLNAKIYEGLYTGHTVAAPLRNFQLTGSYRF